MIFETKRLRVRKLTILDINDFHKMQSNMNVMCYITGKPATFKESVDKLNLWIERYDSKVMDWPFAIELICDNNFVGICGIIEDNEIGYRFLEEFWGNGFGTELVEGIIKYSKKLGLKDLIAEVIIENIRSFKILKNAGFIVENEQICKHTKLPEYIMKLKL